MPTRSIPARRRQRPGPTRALARYKRKRRFDVTTEPGARVGKSTGWIFVVQKHAARRLHYDFRLELDGVLKSWAIPKGPSLRAGDKRLAVEVEDHPVEYASFEGTIPKGEYGGGEVIVWDRGRWSPIGDPREGLAKGRLRFALEGTRLRGQWALVRMRSRKDDGGSSRDQWLLIKSKDAFADTDRDDVTARESTSVVTNRTIEDLAGKHGDERSARAARMPAAIEPELATLVDAPPRDAGWWFELKVDGYRAIAYVDGGDVRIVSRGGLDWTDRYSRIAQALGKLRVKAAAIDGEICFLEDEGKTSFQKLQQALKTGDDSKIVFVIFDILFLDGRDMRRDTLRERKNVLERIMAGQKLPLFLSSYVEGNGERLFREACRRGQEGIIGKRSDRPYVSGRSRDWVKVKCTRRDEFVIVGYTPPKGKRTGLGAIIVATKTAQGSDSPLRFAGKVGTGFGRGAASDLVRRLADLTRQSPPISLPRGALGLKEAQWVDPELVCDVEFTEWTEDQRLRHPVFVGLREDKPAADVSKEQPRSRATVERRGRPNSEPPRPRPRSKTRPPPSPKGALRAAAGSVFGVAISHADRVIDEASHMTKGQLAAYYGFVANRLLAYAHRRPLALVRCPEGIGGSCFFQKHAPEGLSADVRRDRFGKHRVLDVDSEKGIILLVQFGVVEFHGWGSRLPAWQNPDWMVLDLDPDTELPFERTVDAARLLRSLLRRLGLVSFVKTTGGKGLHVVVPLTPEAPFSEVRAFARRLAESLANDDPSSYVATASKKERRGKIFVDYLRNGEEATAVLPYSVRARPGLPVSMPIDWDELGRIDPTQFTASSVPSLLADGKPDPWRDFLSIKQHLPSAEIPARARSVTEARQRIPHRPSR